MTKALVWIQTSFLGDIILSTAGLKLAKTLMPTYRNILCTTSIGREVLKDEPYLDDIIAIDKRKQSLWQTVRLIHNHLSGLDISRRETTVLLPHRSFRSSFLSLAIGHKRIGYYESDAPWMLTHRVPRPIPLHESQRISVLLEPLGIPRDTIVQAHPTLETSENVPERIRHLFSETRPRFGLAPGSVWGTKRWPKEYFAQLANTLLQRDPECQLILLGAPNEASLGDYIVDHIQPTHVARTMNLIGKTSLDELRYIFPRLQRIITNDSSPIHFASAFNIPTLAFFGATVSAMGFGPLAQHSAIAEIDLPCRPCSDHGPMTCPLDHFRCMKDNSVDQALNLLSNMPAN